MAKQGGEDRRRRVEQPLDTLANKLDYLFRQVHGRDRGEFSYREVAGGIERAGGPTISPTYLMYLRKGERINPSKQHMEAIAAFFGVPTAYFLDDETTNRVAEEVELLAKLRDSGVRSLAMRMADLGPDALAAVEQLVDQFGEVEDGTANDSRGKSK